MNSRTNLIFLIFCSIIFVGCSKNNDTLREDSRKKTIQGSVEKGPFVRGSTITIYELNNNLIPTGRSFQSEIRDDKGSFSVPDIDLISDYVQLSVNGFYFNEVRGESSSSPITLNAIANVGEDKSVHVNVLSHLEEKRVRTLISKEKKTFNEAKKQALKEIYAVFFVKGSSSATNSEAISLIHGDKDASVLLGISAALLNAAQSDDPKSIDANLTEILSKVSGDLENDGLVDESMKQSLKDALESLNAESIAENVKSKYEDLNTSGIDFDLEGTFDVEFKGENEPVEEVLEEDEFWNTEEAIKMAYNALLSETVKTFENYFKLEGLYSNTISGLPQHEFYRHQVSASSSNIQNTFTSFYRNIRRANVIIDKTGEHDVHSFRKYKYKVYPYFALHYWGLMNFWGHTVYIDRENYNDLNYFHARMNKKELSGLLLDILDESIQNLGNQEKEADIARAVAARLAADNGNYTKAEKYLKEIMDGARYTLASNAQIHTSGSESVFGIDYNQAIDSKPNDYEALYGKGNYRSVIRYTEIVLLASEVKLKLNKKNEAVSLLNQVRVRNGKSALTINEENVLSLLREELKEDLKNEGIYFAFLKRNNIAESELGIQEYQKLLPIPQRELAINPVMSQNPEY